MFIVIVIYDCVDVESMTVVYQWLVEGNQFSDCPRLPNGENEERRSAFRMMINIRFLHEYDECQCKDRS